MSPFEILYGRPYPFLFSGEDRTQLGLEYLYAYITELQKLLNKVHKFVLRTWARRLDQPIHPFKLGDYIYIKTFSGQPLEEKRKESGRDHTRYY